MSDWRHRSPLRRRCGPAIRIGLCLLPVLLTSCGTLSPANQPVSTGEENVVPPHVSIVFVVHGDGGYGYHDVLGHEHRADKAALARARRVAEQNTDAEVFIFHQKPRHRFLHLFWRVRDGAFYYYRNGRLVADASYRRGWGSSRFAPEVALFRRFHAGGSAGERVFLYFGHEIPEIDGRGYDASNRQEEFTVDDLARGLEAMADHSRRFDLAVLSTCFNGTPYTVAALAPYARYVIASPDNLHLSYFDTAPLETLDAGLPKDSVSTFARQFAVHSFDVLSDELQTAVSVVVYDVGRVGDYLSAVQGLYAASLEKLAEKRPETTEHFDCADDPEYRLPGMSDGVDVYFRAARFGRAKDRASHSGWECVRRSE